MKTFASLARVLTLALLAPAALTGCIVVSNGGDACEYDGVSYEVGDSFPSNDGCNTCSCTEQGVACTEMACEGPMCIQDGQFYLPGESVPSGDSCNSCFCMDDGSVACTGIACDICDYNGQVYTAGQSFPSTDGCNTCTCMQGGMVACTEMACVGCTYNGQTYQPGESFPDACNTCTCMPDGSVACTDMACTCDPANEPNRVYESLDPQECMLLDFACTAPAVRFDNACGCGCETPVP